MLRGKDGSVRYGASRDLIGEIQSWNLDESADTVSGWGMGNTTETTFTTVSRWEGSVECYLDPVDPSYAIQPGDEVAVELYPGGETTGSGYFSGNIIVTGLSRSSSKDGIPMLTINFRNQGALARQTVA